MNKHSVRDVRDVMNILLEWQQGPVSIRPPYVEWWYVAVGCGEVVGKVTSGAFENSAWTASIQGKSKGEFVTKDQAIKRVEMAVEMLIRSGHGDPFWDTK